VRKLSFGAVTYICLYLPIVALASESGVVFDSSLFDEAPIYDSLLVLDESSSPTYDISTAEEELLLFFDEEELFITATKIPQKISEVPAIASAISGDQIRRMGARDITDVLRRIPGLGITMGYYGLTEIEVRGIKTTNSEKVKMLIDGYSVNNIFSGGATQFFGELSVEDVKRIEIIRGPGSALYGSNAVSAVINVITKDGSDMNGASVAYAVGRHNTKKTTLQAGTNTGDFDIAFSLDYLESDGPEMAIENDKFGSTDGRYNKTYRPIERLDAGLKLKYKGFRLNTRYTGFDKGGYVGIGYGANDDTEHDYAQYYTEVSYKYDFEKSSILAKAFLDKFDFSTQFQILPDHYAPLDGVIPSYYQNGIVGTPSVSGIKKGAELQFDIAIAETNSLMVGGLFEHRKTVDSGYKANYDPSTPWAPEPDPLPSGEMEDVKSIANWTQEKERKVWALYVQDYWKITDDFNLTLGVRKDYYSDFGHTTNPRAALVWHIDNHWNLKVLAGRAFRAPTFEELYNSNNGVAEGSADLDPEIMTTYEVSINTEYKNKGSAKLVYFNNRFEEKIQNIGGHWRNTGGAKIWGIEAEWQKNITDQTSTYVNYTFVDSRDDDTKKELADIARHRGNVGVDVKVNQYITMNANALLMDSRSRAPTDTRNDAPAYELVDVAMVAKDFYKTLEIRASIHNLLDTNYADPAPQGTLVDDFPRDGISYRVEVRYTFD